jgi:hypothetical protein
MPKSHDGPAAVHLLLVRFRCRFAPPGTLRRRRCLRPLQRRGRFCPGPRELFFSCRCRRLQLRDPPLQGRHAVRTRLQRLCRAADLFHDGLRGSMLSVNHKLQLYAACPGRCYQKNQWPYVLTDAVKVHCLTPESGRLPVCCENGRQPAVR